jgi:organic radical activating enzyme
MKNDSTLESILKVVEIFHSIQGEGANTGRSAVFVRLANCNLNCSFCDTNWLEYAEMTVSDVLEQVKKFSRVNDYPNNLLIWTGGEPTLQLTNEILENFSGYYNCIETNGTNPVPSLIQYISCSPKVSPEILKRNFNRVNEFRYPVCAGVILPEISELPPADNYFVSPLFVGEEKKHVERNNDNILYSIDYVKKNPQWRLSLQIHKLLNIP